MSRARGEALRGLVERGVISAEQEAAVRDALERAGPGAQRVRWTEIVGYIGGALVLSGVFALVATAWEDLSTATRIALLAALAVAFAVAGIGIAGGPRAMRGRRNGVPTVRRRISGVLLALTSVSASLVTGVYVGEYVVSGDTGGVASPEAGLAAGLVGLVVAAAGYAALPAAVELVACAVMAVTAVFALGDLLAWEGTATGLVLIGLGLALAGLAASGTLAGRPLGLGLGAAIALLGAQYALQWPGSNWPAYVMTLAVAALCLGYYQWHRDAALLVFGILAITIVVPEMVWDFTDGAVGAAAVLLLAGAILLVASWLGIWLHRGRRPEPSNSE